MPTWTLTFLTSVMVFDYFTVFSQTFQPGCKTEGTHGWAHRELSEPMSRQSARLHPPKQAALCYDPYPPWTTPITSALGIHTYPFSSSIRARAVTAEAVIQVLTVRVLYDLCWIAYVQTVVSRTCLVVEPQYVSDPNTLLHTNWTLLNLSWSAIGMHGRCLSICNQSECRITSSHFPSGCTTGNKLLPNSASGQCWKLQYLRQQKMAALTFSFVFNSKKKIRDRTLISGF